VPARAPRGRCRGPAPPRRCQRPTTPPASPSDRTIEGVEVLGRNPLDGPVAEGRTKHGAGNPQWPSLGSCRRGTPRTTSRCVSERPPSRRRRTGAALDLVDQPAHRPISLMLGARTDCVSGGGYPSRMQTGVGCGIGSIPPPCPCRRFKPVAMAPRVTAPAARLGTVRATAWAGHPRSRGPGGRPAQMLDGADDGIRTRDPNLTRLTGT